MRKKSRLTADDNMVNLRSKSSVKVTTLYNLLYLGVAVAHLVDREYAVYVRYTPTMGTYTLRIYGGDENYELPLYSNDDFAEIIAEAMGTLGGKADYEKLVGLLHRALPGLEPAPETRSEAEGTQGMAKQAKDAQKPA